MSPAGAGIALYRRARDWTRIRYRTGQVILAPILVVLVIGTAVLVLGTAAACVGLVYVGFSHAPVLTGAIVAGILLLGAANAYSEG